MSKKSKHTLTFTEEELYHLYEAIDLYDMICRRTEDDTHEEPAKWRQLDKLVKKFEKELDLDPDWSNCWR